MKITSIVVVTGSGADTLLLNTDIPSGCWPYEGSATAKMECAAGTYTEYLESNFGGVPYSVVGVPQYSTK